MTLLSYVRHLHLLKRFESYLTHRSQYVIYDGVRSETKVVECGVPVPQGSNLGPILFIIFMNDICNISDLKFSIMYADDTCFLINGTDMNKLIKQLNVELKSLWNHIHYGSSPTNYH